MTRNLPMVMAATGQLSNLPGVRIENSNLPAIPNGVGDSIENIQQIAEHLASMVNSVKRIQQYEVEAIANQLRVAGMPDPTVFQKAGAIFHQNYAREKHAAERTVSEAAEISRGYARALGHDMSGIPDSQIHGANYGKIGSDLERTVVGVVAQMVYYQKTLSDRRVQEIEGYSAKAAEIIRAMNLLSSGNGS